MARSDTDPESRRRRRRLITLAAIAVVLAILTGIGIYGLVLGEPPARPATPPSHTEDPSTPGATTPADTVPPLPRTTDPQAFATAVAHALFEWNTYTLLSPTDHRDVLLQVADPSGQETPGLVSDLDNYLPDADTWTRLQEYQTRQWLSIDRLYVPDQWHEALAAGGDAIAEGTVAYTVEGVRHREGVWYDDPVSSQHDVAFTIFLVCEPAASPCALLRLSILDQPLR